MDEQINRTILDNFDVESVQHEIYKMSGTEVLKGLENGSLQFITVPREEFIDHTLLPEYITTHGFIIDTMLDGANTSTNESLQHSTASYIAHHSGQTLVNSNEIQLPTNIDEPDKQLNAALLRFLKSGNVKVNGGNTSETQVIVTNKDLINLTGTQVIDATIKNDNSNSLDTSTFLTFNDDQSGLSNSLISDGQFRIFQQLSPNTHQQQQHIQINALNNSSLPQLTPIRRLNRSRKNSISLNITDQLTIDDLKTNTEIEQIQSFQHRPAAKRILPHKKRITKKLKSIDGNQKVDVLFQHSDNSVKSTNSQIQFFQDLNEEINADEVINLNSPPQFSCQICGAGAESQLDFFAHLKLHYEPKPESGEILEAPVVKNQSQKEFITQQSQSEPQIQMSMNQQQFTQIPLIKRANQVTQSQRLHQNHTQPSNINETMHLPHMRRQISPSDLQNISVQPVRENHHTDSEEGYILTTKKIVESRDLPDVTNFAFEGFAPMGSVSNHSHSSHTVVAKDIMNSTHEYEILDSSLTNHLRHENAHQMQLTKTDFLPLQSASEHQITLPSRALLNSMQVEDSRMLLHQGSRSNALSKNCEVKSQSSHILQNNTVYSTTTIPTSSQIEQSLFENPQYFEAKFNSLPNQVLNLEHKIDTIRVENDISHSISNRKDNLINSGTLSQPSLICEDQNSLHQLHIANSQSANEGDGTENITPSIGELNETSLQTNSHKSSTNGIVILQNDEVEFSDPEDMLEGIRGVVDKVQESFDTGDEMDAMSPPRNNWFPNNGFNSEINSKTICDPTRYETITPVENFQIFFKNDENNDMKKESAKKVSELSEPVVNEEPSELLNNDISNRNNTNSLLAAENSLASSTTNTVHSQSENDNQMPVKMENFSTDYEDSNTEKTSSSLGEPVDSPTSQISEKETLKNCGVLSGKKERKKYFCDKCFKVFNSSNALKYHDFAHSGKRPFPCEECGKSFFAQNALRAHLRVHSGEKPFTCVDCGRAFRQWGDLNYHRISLHSNEKNFQCEFCGKAFARKYSLVIHRRIHTQEKNYKCEFCPKTFRASSYLQNHRKIHTGEKPYECPTCNKKFRVCGDLRRHQKIHDRTKQVHVDEISLSNVTALQLSDTVLNIEGQENNTFIEYDKSNKNQTDLNTTVFMYSSDGNLDQLFKTDNISNQIKDISSTTLPLNITGNAAEIKNLIKNDNNIRKLALSTSSTEFSSKLTPAESLVTTSNANKKVSNKNKKQKSREKVT
ncbi:uncharacterized protein LOC129615091 [Condylostylus longicornis]|uniref:uncharacterized protein LOC129615091 n=1 Tax=Condylostylus longicornis TaxID=2530218 RepID=UPI00244E098F|nr:uncharacterized protein LOC129615091 [Condylostylus longicornis]